MANNIICDMLKCVNKDPSLLMEVKEQTPEICMAAVKQDGWALQHVKDQTSQICLEAVKKDRNAKVIN